VARLFFLLSGEHENLPASELKAILEAEGHEYTVLEKLDQVIRIEAGLDCLKAVENRAAFTRTCGLELFNCEATTNAIIKNIRSTSLDTILEKGESFAVRIRRVRRYAPRIDLMALERKLGELVLTRNDRVHVNLKKPDKTFAGILTDEKLIFGLKLAEIPAKPFVERRPRKKPFFHPSAMQAKLARCMVNLAKPKAGDLLMDPFCGTGSIIIEASLIGCRGLGLDIQRRMARGTLRNSAHFKVKPEGVILADARSLPLTKIDCVVTDPPYGISSTTMKRTIKQIVEELLTSIHEKLDKEQRICMASPKNLGIGQIGIRLGYKHLESHFVYVHRSLTREIAVFEKV
jgi:tRNA (guanine10-N2)-dimethyltransferase